MVAADRRKVAMVVSPLDIVTTVVQAAVLGRVSLNDFGSRRLEGVVR